LEKYHAADRTKSHTHTHTHTHKDLRTRSARIAAGIVALVLFVSANVFAAPVHRAAKPITDDQGRTRIIIDFEDTAQDAYPAELIAKFNPKTDRVHPQVEALIQTYERQHGFTRAGITSWVGASVTAYLTATQIEQLSSDKNVRLLTEDRAVTYSGLWSDYISGGETTSWGTIATGGKSKLPDTNRPIYIIDSGAALHEDLASFSSKVNVACGSGGNCSYGDTWNDHNPTVGCYSHATHVAGIIGASGNNGKTSRGVYSGANMISVATTYREGFPTQQNPCGQMPPTLSIVGYAFDYIFQQTLVNTSVVPIVNFSLNWAGLGFSPTGTPETNRAKLLSLVQPRPVFWGGSWRAYSGVFFAQSAGNVDVSSPVDVCSSNAFGGNSIAYVPQFQAAAADPYDGIMVVGALNEYGRTVAYSDAPFRDDRFSTPVPSVTGTEYYSARGACVDIWAPGNSIFATWGAHTGYSVANITYAGNDGATEQGWARISGTSMAAPHVAAVAAYLADYYGLTTPAAIEAAVRNASLPPTSLVYPFVANNSAPYTDFGLPVRMVRIP